MIKIIKNSKNGKSVGIFSKDKDTGTFIESWKKALKAEDFDSVRKIYVLFYEITIDEKYFKNILPFFIKKN